jgi:hypothetical protein
VNYCNAEKGAAKSCRSTLQKFMYVRSIRQKGCAEFDKEIGKAFSVIATRTVDPIKNPLKRQ